MATADFSPFSLDLVLYAGDYHLIPFAWAEGEAGSEVAINLTGYIIVGCHWRKKRADETGAIELDATITSAVDGEIEIEIDEVMSRAMAKTGFWDLELLDSGGKPFTLTDGEVETKGDVTRA